MADGGRTLPKVLVAGGTGYLGGHVIRALHAAGYPVRALARDEARLAPVRDFCDEVFLGQATDPATLAGVVGDAKVLFSSLGKRDFKRRPTATEVDGGANLNLVRAAAAAGVEHVVFISVLHGARMRAAGLAAAAARESVVDALQASGMAWTILRPTGFFNDMQDLFRMAARGTAWMPGDGSFRINPIHGADLAGEVVRCLQDPEARGRQFDVGGPDVLTFREMAELAFASLGRPPKLRRLPLGLLRAAAVAARPFHPFASDFLRMFLCLAEWEGVAPPCGSHHLADFYRDLAQGSGGT